MTPAQMRMARAALHWSVEQLAEKSGVHRNTISNFETGRYAGDPEKRDAIKRTLESAGVIFTDENREDSGVMLRRFREGDLVRFRAQTRMRSDYGIEADEVGTVVGVEPHPPQTGPTYKIAVQFPKRERALPYVFWPEYELVQAAPATD
jgi:transcriptional regulator with XRE-family HTH domain